LLPRLLLLPFVGILEVIWKLVATIIDGRLKAAIPFHDTLHGFRPRRGTGTFIIEAKLFLFQQLASIQQVPLFEVFLDLKKARRRTLWIVGGRWRSWNSTAWEKRRYGSCVGSGIDMLWWRSKGTL
jgi:hypothetical protein